MGHGNYLGLHNLKNTHMFLQNITGQPIQLPSGEVIEPHGSMKVTKKFAKECEDIPNLLLNDDEQEKNVSI